MRVAIMQPYFLPYIGYFQLISAVDLFVIYDNIKYTKKGWINRNRFLQNNTDAIFSIPLKKASDHLNVDQRELSESFNKRKLLDQFSSVYQKSPGFKAVMPVIRSIVEYTETNLFEYILHSVEIISEFLDIGTKIVRSSEIAIDHSLQGQDKVLAICEHLSATVYVNAIGGQRLYTKDAFRAHGIELNFLESVPVEYPQMGNAFVAWLSIIDVMMFVPRNEILGMLNKVTLV